MSRNLVNPITGSLMPIAGYGQSGNFEGSWDQWNALTETQKAQFRTMDINNDFNGMPIDTALDSTSEHVIQNKPVAENIEAIVNTYGSKNLCVYPYFETTEVEYGITWTDIGDGTITADGKISGSHYSAFGGSDDNITFSASGTYIFTGCPSGGSDSTYYINVTLNGTSVGHDTGNGVQFTATAGQTLSWGIAILDTVTTFSNLTFKPMLRDARISDDTYVPYTMTNKRLTDTVNILKGRMKFSPSPYINTSTIAYLAEKLISYMADMDEGVYIMANGWAQHSEGYHAICIKSYYNDSISSPVYSGTVYEYANMKVYAFTSRGSTIKTTELN